MALTGALHLNCKPLTDSACSIPAPLDMPVALANYVILTSTRETATMLNMQPVRAAPASTIPQQRA
jgi:hypothetical protein